MILRFDDTNPAKECTEFEQAILDDLPRLGVRWDVLSHTSDHFDSLLEFCDILLQKGLAYVDDTDPELMKAQRERREASICRDNSMS
ncbi:unnamed protein product [Protopolystoma xenopodis]|uniref:Glutamyl/glutaminyl-tRNA synthetase class Ib catalytic domain-containing protein n=1 Tax=Protopolystoma xenopodis TaxID=117903 RepID=A0A3S5CJ95_9PLAT|nr:unnamed protein product [Protopolystoma xenopodis]